MTERTVLITGCSSGIGRAAAAAFQAKGWTVVATARRPEDITDLADRGIETLALDVLDGDSMQRAVSEVISRHGAVDVLVNNAGYALQGPVEEAAMADVRRQFETNVFGLVQLTQLVLPGMRERRRGRIINISSMGGRFTFPGGAFYHASKHAVEALSDALRLEVSGFGIGVVLIEPGPVLPSSVTRPSRRSTRRTEPGRTPTSGVGWARPTAGRTTVAGGTWPRPPTRSPT